MVHLTDVVNVGLFLGGRNFTACAALGSCSLFLATKAVSPGATGVPLTSGASLRGLSAMLAAEAAMA